MRTSASAVVLLSFHCLNCSWFIGSSEVHPNGQFINHSVHVGFSEPPICSLNGRELRIMVASLALPLRQSRAVGVAHNFTALPSVSPKPFPFLAFSFARSRLASMASKSLHSKLFAVGVGQKPEAVSLVIGANVGRSHNSPPTVIPQRG